MPILKLAAWHGQTHAGFRSVRPPAQLQPCFEPIPVLLPCKSTLSMRFCLTPSTRLQACTWPRPLCLFLAAEPAELQLRSPRYLFAALQVRTQRGILPDDHPQRASALLERAVAYVEGGNRQGALEVLRPMMDEDAEVGEGWHICTARHCLDFELKHGPGQRCAPVLCGCSLVTSASSNVPARLADAFMLLPSLAVQHHLQLGFLRACKFVKKGSRTLAPALCSCADLRPPPGLASGAPPIVLMLPLYACLSALYKDLLRAGSTLNKHTDLQPLLGQHSGLASTDLLMQPLHARLQALQEGLQDPLPPHFGAVLTLAHFLDHMYATRPAKQIEASPWYEDAIEMVRQELRQIYKAAQKVRGSP